MNSVSPPNLRILVVDDQAEIHDDFDEMLAPNLLDPAIDAFGGENDDAFLPAFELSHAMSGEQAYDMVKAAADVDRPFALAYIDIRMPPGIDGIETIRLIREFERSLEIVIMTAYTDKPLSEIVDAMVLPHKLLYIRKPFAREEIQQTALALVEKWNVERELASKRRQLEVSHQRLEAVLDGTGDAIGMFDGSGCLVVANRWYEQLFDATESQLKDMSPQDLKARTEERLRTPALSEWRHRGPDAAAGGVVSIVEAVAAVGETGPRLFSRSIVPVPDPGQAPVGHLAIYRDMSREAEVQKLKAEVLRLRGELETTYGFEGMAGTSRAMQEVYALMQHTLENDIAVLIQGESGTGKELVAKAIHYGGPRKEQPFVAINCAAIPETLIESELFGYERGSYTGATARHPGMFERAHGGTIFLDEIGDMPFPLQAKLLRVLNDGEVQRVGGTVNIPVDVRVISATNNDLDSAIQSGAFRSDLFYRLAAFPLTLPPLRERREDIPQLAELFLEKSLESTNKAIGGIDPAALQLLLAHDWPGNVRELKNAIERAVLLETTDRLQVASLPSPILTASSAGHVPSETVCSLAEAERQAIRRALEAADHDVEGAAEVLGISRATLYRKLSRHDLPAKP